MGDQVKHPRAAELVPYELLYPPEESQKAAKLVQDEISNHRNQLDSLRLFAAENTNLINLVRRLPDELSHEIMVPFGKAAFFPGRLIHTNEFLVLLGEGYYADQTAKQTIGVLKRRGQVLDSNVEALDALISDMQARAKFYDDTANESGEGMVEIREYEEFEPKIKENSASMASYEGTNAKIMVTDEDYAKVLAGLEELEKAELAAENALHDGDNETIEVEANKPNLQENLYEKGHKLPEIKNGEETSKNKGVLQETALRSSENFSEQHLESKLSLGDKGHEIAVAGKISKLSEHGTKDGLLLESSHSTEKSSLTINRDNIQRKPLQKDKMPLQKDKSPAENSVMQTCTTAYSHRKAFTGAIIEHNNELKPDLSTQNTTQAVTPNPSRPVSRFKLQKGR